MTTETLKEKIRAYIAATCLVSFDDPNINDDTDLFETGLLDSYSFVELVNFLEREFGLKVTDDDLVLESFNSVDELVRYVGDKQHA